MIPTHIIHSEASQRYESEGKRDWDILHDSCTYTQWFLAVNNVGATVSRQQFLDNFYFSSIIFAYFIPHLMPLQLTPHLCNTPQHTAAHCSTLQSTAHGVASGAPWPDTVNPGTLCNRLTTTAPHISYITATPPKPSSQFFWIWTKKIFDVSDVYLHVRVQYTHTHTHTHTHKHKHTHMNTYTSQIHTHVSLSFFLSHSLSLSL